eukprot:Hpha_TRINITY_DN2497_c0_g1::TRINITY_DN2497_c0_g1_i1::g.24655::m.24655
MPRPLSPRVQTTSGGGASGRASVTASPRRAYEGSGGGLGLRNEGLGMRHEELRAALRRSEMLEGDLRQKEKELYEQKRRVGDLEVQLGEAQSSSALRVLEGKVAGLQGLLDDRAVEHERLLGSREEMRGRLEETIAARERDAERIDALEKERGEQIVHTEELRRELAREQRKGAGLQQDVDAQQERAHAAEQMRGAVEQELERAEQSMRGDARARQRELREMELDRLSLREQLVGLQKQLEEAHQRCAHFEAAAQDVDRRFVEQREDRERAEAAAARQGVVAEGLERELEREQERCQALLADLRQGEQQRIALEGRLGEMEAALSEKAVLRDHLRQSQDQIAQAESVAAEERERHEHTRQLLAEQEERLQDVAWLQHSLQQAEADAAAKAEAIERLHAMNCEMERSAAETREAYEQQHHSVAATSAELDGERRACREWQRRAEQLDGEAHRAAELERALRETEQLLASREQALAAAESEAARGGQAAVELEQRLRELQELEGMLMQERASAEELSRRLRQADDRNARLEAESQRVQARADQAAAGLEAERQQVAQRDAQIGELRQQTAAKAALEHRISQLQLQMEDATEEFTRERLRNGETLHAEQQRTLAAQTEAAAGAQRAAMLERELELRTRLVDELQTDKGRQSVLQEKHARAAMKLEQELALRDESLRKAKEELEAATGELGRVKGQVQLLESRAGDWELESKRQARENEDATAALSTATAQLNAERDRAQGLESRLQAQERDAVRTATLEGRMQALEAVHEANLRELEEAQKSLSDTRIKLKDAEAAAQRTKSLEDRVQDLSKQLQRQEDDMERIEQEQSRERLALTEARRELEREAERGRVREGQLKDANARAETAQGRVTILERSAAERGAVQGKLAGLERLAEAKEQELAAAEEQRAALRQRVTDLELQLQQRRGTDEVTRDLEGQLSVKQETVSRLELEVARRQSDLDQRERELRKCEERAAVLDQELAEQSSLRLTAESRLRELQRELERRDWQASEDLRELGMHSERSEAQNREAKTRMMGAERDAEELRLRAKDLSQELSRLRRELQKSDSDRLSVVRELNDIKRQANRDSQEQRSSIQDVKRLHDASAAKDGEIQRLRAELRQVQSSSGKGADELSVYCSELKDENTKLRDRAEYLTTQWVQMREIVARLQKDLPKSPAAGPPPSFGDQNVSPVHARLS